MSQKSRYKDEVQKLYEKIKNVRYDLCAEIAIFVV